jgi:hypothetical protein
MSGVECATQMSGPGVLRWVRILIHRAESHLLGGLLVVLCFLALWEVLLKLIPSGSGTKTFPISLAISWRLCTACLIETGP